MGDTWGWDGQDWVQLADTGPSARAQHAMTCDPSRGRVVLFSGGQTAPLASDTWEWAGDWVQVADTGPTARLGAKLASVNDGVLLFGGIGADEAAPRDTWSWDGHQWKQVADTGPAPRAGHAMASDGTVAVLFGGQLLVPSPDLRTTPGPGMIRTGDKSRISGPRPGRDTQWQASPPITATRSPFTEARQAKPCSETLGGLRTVRNQAVSTLGRLTVASHAKALTDEFWRPRQTGQSDQGYNDHADR